MADTSKQHTPPAGASGSTRMWLRVGIAVVAAAALGVALLLRPGDPAATGSGTVVPGGGVGFEIRAPVEGATVGAPVRLDVALDGSTLGQPSAGLDHLHISLDGGQPIAEYETTQLALSPVPAGRHTLTVELAGPGHQPLLPAKSVGFTVAP